MGAQAATRIIGPLAAAGFAVAPLVADVIGFVAAQNPAWLQPGLDPAKLSWAPPTTEHCASMAGLPAVQVGHLTGCAAPTLVCPQKTRFQLSAGESSPPSASLPQTLDSSCAPAALPAASSLAEAHPSGITDLLLHVVVVHLKSAPRNTSKDPLLKPPHGKCADV